MHKHLFLKTAAASVAILVAGTTAASAHHCYKDDWMAAAYEHLSQGGTPWVPVSDLGVQFIIPPELQADCGYVADLAVADYMEAHGLEQEPLIHGRATVGGGALYNAGKEPKPFSYLDDDDFGELTVTLLGYLEECAAGLA